MAVAWPVVTPVVGFRVSAHAVQNRLWARPLNPEFSGLKLSDGTGIQSPARAFDPAVFKHLAKFGDISRPARQKPSRHRSQRHPKKSFKYRWLIQLNCRYSVPDQENGPPDFGILAVYMPSPPCRAPCHFSDVALA